MESWRERGFVPDSDSEVDFDSQESKVVNGRFEDGDGGTEEVVAPNAKLTAPAADVEANEGERDGAGDDGTGRVQNVVLSSKDIKGSTPAVDKAEDDSTMVDLRKTSQSDSGSVQENQKDPASQSAPATRKVADSSSSSSGVTTTNPSTPSTPRTQPLAGIWDIPSSPDELQFDLQPSRRRVTYFSKRKDSETQKNSSTVDEPETQLVNDNDNISPISSPLSSLHSIPLGEDDDNLRDRQEGQNGMESTQTQAPQNREELLLPFEIPDHILQEMSQPMRRSLRQRNPIQLHPYLLEDAKYRSLMKARGLKPVRVPLHQAVHGTADESQSKDFEPPSSSPVEDFQFPPSSPTMDQPLPDRYVHKDSLHRRGRLDPQPQGHLANRPDARPSKRRRVSRPGDADRRSLEHAPQPKVVIGQSPARPEHNSIFNIPSPPRSGSISSTQTSQHAEGFRFPLGFTPPTLTTPVTEPRVNGRNAINSDMTDWLTGADDQVSVDGEATDQSQPNSNLDEDAPDEDDEQVAVRALQRKIKGVLPASWLRLDQKNQRQGNLPSTQRQRDRLAPHRTENSKGVARKIPKKNDSRMDSTAREPLASLSNLADDDSAESSGAEEDMPVDAHKKMAELFQLDLPFDDDIAGDDIPESDHIDYMFPPMPRGSTGPRSRKPGKKRQRTETGGSLSHSHIKRPRLKRQTRITDPEYAARKERAAPRRLPRLGILDAPDVAHRSRNEQPQFLRVAARRARSRKDMGRRSPSRKFIKLGSRLDTEDANKALGEWRKGKLRQTQLPQVQIKLNARPPLLDRPVNQPAAVTNHSPYLKESCFLPDPKTAQVDLTDDGLDETRPDVPAITPTTERDISSRPKPASGQQGRKWVIRRNFAVSSLKRNGPRPAEPEITDSGRTSASPSLFQKTLALLNRDYRHKHPTHRSLPLDRYLANSVTPSLPTKVQSDVPAEIPNAAADASPAPPSHNRRRQLKKRPPRRLDLGTLDSQEVDTRDSVTILPTGGVVLENSRSTISTGNGLKSFRRAYTVDFDITPLCPGTFFHESTFIGSGQFSRALKVESRNMDEKTGLSRIKLSDQFFRWGPWNDMVSSELGQVFDVMIEEIEEAASETATSVDQGTASHDACALYRSLIQYVTEHLAFEDPIDRMGFVKRAQSLVAKLNEQLPAVALSDERQRGYLTQIASYNLVFATQALQVACHALVDGEIAHEISDMVKFAARRVLGFIASRTAQIQMRTFLQDNKSPTKREPGIQEDQSVIEAYVIARHVLQSMDGLKGCFGELIAEAYLSAGGDPSDSRDIDGFENGWQSLFTTLPLNEFDSYGLVRIGARFREAHDNWLMVKRLLSPVLDNYDTNAETQPISCNNYCRALFRRCYHLINGWGWRDCRPIMQLLYDFFAKRHLYDLKLEESYKSPSFLDELDRNPSFDVQPDDPSYHIFLKILATGLRFLPLSCDKKQIRNFAWRLLPNHDGRYPKEKPISQSDLDAVRNHHDLLCTLYFAVPDGCRPRLEIIKTLVDPAISHRETCNISIRTWSRLVRFKLSTDEDLSGLEPFADWHCYFLGEFLKQHSLARKEIEAQNAIAKNFSHEEVEKTISQNQRQIESLLTMALGGLQNAVRAAPTLEHARLVVSKAPIRAILGLFNPRVARVNAVVSEALQVIIAYLQKCNTDPVPAAKAPTIPVDEDSQEYGDWTDIEAIYGDESPLASKGVEHVESVFLPAVSRLVSNCFGEDHCPEDAILLNVVDCWTFIASVLVKHGLKHWDNYLGHYDGESWSSLRSTVQTRKFTPLFLASCIERDPRCLSECRLLILSMWLSSLVERVSMLKFQHRLTEALLNLDTTDPLLHNLPFSKDRQSDRYSLSLEDLSQRRLSLLSSLLSNMRAHVQDLEDTENRELTSTRRDYRELIQRMMASMKANYQELGNGGGNAQGAYVDFVHRIVGFLQQYSRDICPIDPFFTDPTSFPLPSADPTYIVARLKSYEPKLCSEKVVKTLIVFVQGVSERAAIDGQQVYLVDQLHTSMADIYETGDPCKPTLRAVLLQCVFSAYIECAFSNPAAWVLSRPIIQTVSLVFKDLLFFIDITDAMCRSSIVAILGAIFRSSYQAVRYVTGNPLMRTDSTVIATLTSLVEMITSAITVVDYIDRATDMGRCAVSQIGVLRELVLFVTSSLLEQPLASEVLDRGQSSRAFDDDDTTNHAVPSFFHDLHTAATHELQAYLNDSWSQHQGKYYFTRRGGHQPQEVQLEPSVAAEIERTPVAAFNQAVQTFLDTVRAVDLFDEAD
ncbi:hypothetical protein CNMCM5878_009755 [Aspergillus fumigatiaffinis]|nr:hypothetical protein CNMCM5878_009755 [Aspergillus fumigatiaffinis]